MKSKLRLKRVRDQVIVITGASSGIGRATAEAAADKGARLVLASRDGEALQQMAEAFRRVGTEALAVTADVGIEADHRRILDEALARFGRVDTWVNNAGVSIFGRIEEVPFEDQRKLFDTNFWGVVYGSVVALGYLKQHGGALINLGSEVSDVAVPLQGVYSASKHAVKGYTDALRMELQDEGAPVSVTLIKPAAIDSSFVQNAKNYLDVEAQLPQPIYAPAIVADAILYAAAHPIRDVYVGAASRATSAFNKYAPSLMDRLGSMFIRQQRTETPAQEQGGALYESRHAPAKRGNTSQPVMERSLYTWLATSGRGIVLGGIIVGLALGAAQWRPREERPAERS
jgi:short-subunit dehydrogenase